MAIVSDSFWGVDQIKQDQQAAFSVSPEKPWEPISGYATPAPGCCQSDGSLELKL